MWRIFENWDGSFSAFYEGPFDGLYSLIFLFVFGLMMALLGSVIYPYLTIPLLSLGLGVGLMLLCSDEDMLFSPATFMPLLVYGWASICWLIIVSNQLAQTGLIALMGWLVMAIVGILGIVVPMVELMDAGAAVTLIVMAVLWFASLTAEIGTPASSGAGKAFLYSFRVLLIMAVSYTGYGVFLKAKSLSSSEQARKDAVAAVASLAAGFLPLVVGALLSAMGPLVVLVGVLASYAGLGVAAHVYKDNQAQWALVPLLVCGTFAFAAQAPTQLLPPYEPALAILDFCRNGMLARLGAAGALPIAQSLSWMLSGVTHLLLNLVLRIFDTSVPSFILPQPLCLYLGLAIIPVAMGLASTAYQKVASLAR